MSTSSSDATARRVFARLLARPGAVVAASVATAALFGAFLPYLHKDSRAEAFIPPDNAVLALQLDVEHHFGMSDPMAILVVNEGPTGIFTSHTLQLVARLTLQAQQLEGVEPGGVTSLATVRVVEGAAGVMNVVPVLESDTPTPRDAARVAGLSRRHAMLRGALVSEDEQSTLIVIERFDDARGLKVYRDLSSLAAAADTSGGERIHVTGHGALTATLGEYIDSDTQILYVAVTVLIAIVLAVAFRTFYGVMLPLLLVGATLAICVGTMGITGAPFTVITSALPVVLSALVVTDGIHILSAYYEGLAHAPERSTRELILDAMVAVWRPCVGSRVTDIAGFAGLYLGSQMPPMKSFGLYGSVGIAAEMVLALVAYPSLLLLTAPRPSPAFAAGDERQSRLPVRRWLETAAGAVLRQSSLILAASAVIVVAGISGAWMLVVNDSWMKNFDAGAPVRHAAEELERRYGIVTDLDLIVDSGEPDGMLAPAMLERLRTLTTSLYDLPFVTKVRSIADELSEIHRGMQSVPGGDDAAAALPQAADGSESARQSRPAMLELPQTRELASQYLLIADSAQTRRWLDADQRRALVRVHTRANEYVAEKLLVEKVDELLKREIPDPPPVVSVTGMAAVGVAWVSGVGNFHVLSTLLSVGFCWLQMAAGFRSWAMGTLAVVPMAAAMLLMYAVMGWGGIPLGIGTSMFAALAIGTGVDFAIHTIDRFMVLHEKGSRSLADSLCELLPTTGRAIFYSGAALILGFSALCTSHIPAVRSLGILVTVSVAASLVATLTLLPALIKVLRPRALVGSRH